MGAIIQKPGIYEIYERVCLCVGHTGELCKNGWTNRDAVWGWLMWAQGTMY